MEVASSQGCLGEVQLRRCRQSASGGEKIRKNPKKCRGSRGLAVSRGFQGRSTAVYGAKKRLKTRKAPPGYFCARGSSRTNGSGYFGACRGPATI